MDTPVFPKGYVLTDFGSMQLTIEDQAAGGQGAVVWGPNAAKGGKWVALKMVRPDRASEAARSAFEQEALAWCHLWPHPCIITASSILHLPGLNNLPVLELEYAPNGSLRDLLHKAHQPNNRIPLKLAFAWAQMIAAALEAIHTPDPDHERFAPLVHCDLKPENVLLDKQGWTMLTDLGLAKAYAEGGVVPVQMATSAEDVSDQMTIVLDAAQLTHSRRYTPDTLMPEMGTQGAVQGTLPYMPPEQWRGMEAVVPATDIYACGVLLFELFAGVDIYPHVPQRRTTQGWYEAHWQGPTRHLQDTDVRALEKGPLSEVATGVGGAQAYRVADQLDALIGQCLAHQPQDRPDAQTVRQRLGEMATLLGFAPQEIPEVTPHTPRNESAFWNNLAMTYGNIGQKAEQLRLLAKAKDLDPENPNKWYMYGKALHETNRQEEALDMLTEAEQRLTPEWLKVYPQLAWQLPYACGNVSFALQLYLDAVASYRQALQRNSDYGPAWFNLAICLAQLALHAPREEQVQYWREAQEAMAQAYRLMPDDPDTQRLHRTYQEALLDAERRLQAGG